MKRARFASVAGLLENLEPRRLLAFAPVGDEVVVAQGATISLDSDLAVAGNGSFLIASIDFDSAQDTLTVLARRYAPGGQPVGMPIVLSTLNTSNLPAGSRLAASMDADGDAVVAYKPLLSGTIDPIHVFRISKEGTVSAEQLIGSGRVGYPSVSMDAGGGYFLGWVEQTQAVTILAKVRAFDESGTPRGNEITVAERPPESDLDGGFDAWLFEDLDVASLPDGSGAVFAFEEDSPKITQTPEVRFGRTSATAMVGTLGQVDHSSETAAGTPSIAVHADGSFVIGYAGGFEGRGLLQRYDAAGAAVGSVIDPGNALPAGVPMGLDDLGDGGFVVAFPRRSPGETETINVRRYNAAGAPDPSGSITVDTLPLGQSAFAESPISADDNGNAVAAWKSVGQTSTLTFRRFSEDASVVAVLNGRTLHVSGTGGPDLITVSASGSNIVVTGGAASETFSLADVDVLVVEGLGGHDTITNDTNLNATLLGGDGHDTIFGGSGEDRIHGGVGDDSIWGNAAPDTIYGEDGRDSLYGNGSNDRIYGGAQSDFIRGNGGRDQLYGNGGNDRIHGGASGDRISGQAGNDRIFGEGGDDRLYGDDTVYDDSLFGGAGNDFFITLDSALDHVFGDGGDDFANADPLEDILESANLATIDA